MPPKSEATDLGQSDSTTSKEHRSDQVPSDRAQSYLLGADLLQPSLQGRAARQQPYSDTATFVVSFFGGGPAAIAISLLNARRMGRPRSDALVAGVCFVIWLGVLFYVVQAATGQVAPGWLGEGGDVVRSGRRLNQGLGLLIGGVFYLLHRSARRASHLGSEDPPRAWGVGIVAILASGGLTVLLALLMAWLGGHEFG